jgi:heme oxygenase
MGASPRLRAGPAVEAWQRSADQLPWPQLRRSEALQRDLAQLSVLPATPEARATQEWLERLRLLAGQAPHQRLAHAYVRYGGDLSGGQRLAAQAQAQAQAILARHSLPPLAF